jgi:hypothetical protein
VHPIRRTGINAIATEWAREQFIIHFIVRDEAEALVADALALGNFFIIVAVTHRWSPEFTFGIMTAKRIVDKVWLFSKKSEAERLRVFSHQNTLRF